MRKCIFFMLFLTGVQLSGVARAAEPEYETAYQKARNAFYRFRGDEQKKKFRHNWQNLAESFGEQSEAAFKPVLVRFDDLAQLAFEIERGPDDLVTVYLPGSPDPWSGSVAQVTADRVDALTGEFPPMIKSFRKFGRGSTDLLAEKTR